jgi:hypothetical protein
MVKKEKKIWKEINTTSWVKIFCSISNQKYLTLTKNHKQKKMFSVFFRNILKHGVFVFQKLFGRFWAFIGKKYHGQKLRVKNKYPV